MDIISKAGTATRSKRITGASVKSEAVENTDRIAPTQLDAVVVKQVGLGRDLMRRYSETLSVLAK